MRSLLVVCAVVSVLAFTGMASAANPGQVPNATLAQLGLSGMQTMSDVQGTDIRGMGFATVSGYSATSWSGADSGYSATAIGWNAATGGVDVSATGKIVVFSGGTFVAAKGSVAGSASFAIAK
jgi:predicted metal-binding membrane protein